MKKSKRILSLLTALTITASAFASLAIPASAADDGSVILAPITYDNDGATADWTTGTSGRFDPVILEEDGNKYLSVNQGNRNNNGTTIQTAGNYAGSGFEETRYAVEFDLKISSSTDQTPTEFLIETTEAEGTGKLLSLTATGSWATTWTVNGSDPITLPDTNKGGGSDTIAAVPWYHFVVAYAEGTTYVTITEKKEGSEVLKQTLVDSLTQTGKINRLQFITKRYNANFAIDNFTIRHLNNKEVPDTKFYKVSFSTTRYAKIEYTLNSGAKQTAYADVDGKYDLTLLPNETVVDYTISKTGYTAQTGSVTIDGDNAVVDKSLVLTDDDGGNIIFYEADFGNDNGVFAVSGRGGNIGLGNFELPDMATVSMDFAVDTEEETQLTWLLKNSAGVGIVGLQGTSEGLIAFTNWGAQGKASPGMSTNGTIDNQVSSQFDIANYGDHVTLADSYVGSEKVSFTINKTAKNITVKYGEVAASLPIPEAITTIDIGSMAIGKYREKATVTIDNFEISKPDPYFVDVFGDTGVAKIKGKTITREYKASPAVMLEDEAFTWTVTDAAGDAITGVTIDAATGVLSIADTATPGKAIVKAASDKVAEGAKNGILEVTIGDFQQFTITADGPQAYDVTDTDGGQYTVSSVVDTFSDEVKDLVTIKWSSSDTDVATINEDTGALTVVGKGTTTITAKITNDTVESTATIPVKVDTYYKTLEVTTDATTMPVTTTDIVSDNAITGYLVTTSKNGELIDQYEAPDTVTVTKTSQAGYKITATYADGKLVSAVPEAVAEGTEAVEPEDANTKIFYWDSLAGIKPILADYEEQADNSTITVNVAGADKVEVAPIYKTTMNTLMAVPADRYNVTVTANNGRRTDAYVNNQMMINNINQSGDNWTIGRIIAESTDHDATDIEIPEGYAKFRYMDDQSGGTTITGVKFVKAPSIVNRAKRVYVIGDSLVANYYGTAPEGNEGLVRTGWGQVLADYIVDSVNVTNLGNSGAKSDGMYNDAFTNVRTSAHSGDILVLESGYNDTDANVMKDAIKKMVKEAEEKGVLVFVVPPNASSHSGNEYLGFVKQHSNVRAAVTELKEDGNNPILIDLSAKSGEFFKVYYGDASYSGDTPSIPTATWNIINPIYNNEKDSLHSSYNAANCWAAIVANGLYTNNATKDIVDTTHTYTFNDGVKDITVSALKPISYDNYDPQTITFTATDVKVTRPSGVEITSAVEGDAVKVTVLTEGATSDNTTLTVVDGSSNAVEATYNSTTKAYYFKMPDSAVTITATVTAAADSDSGE